MPEYMFYFCSEIECQLRKFLSHRANNAHGVVRAVQKVRVAECDMADPRGCQIADIFQHHILRHNKEAAIVDRWNRTMGAMVEATAAGLNITCQLPLSSILKHRVLNKRRQPSPIRHWKIESLENRILGSINGSYTFDI